MSSRVKAVRHRRVWVVMFAAAVVASACALSPAPPTPPPTPDLPSPAELIVDGRCESPRRAGSPSAFTALRSVLPQLAALHPNGQVVTIFGSGEGWTSGESIRRWEVHVWAPVEDKTFPYMVDDGRLTSTGSATRGGGDSPSIADLAATQFAIPVQDSHEIATHADALGGHTYCEQTARPISWMQLLGRKNNKRLIWLISYKYGVGGASGTGLELVVDASSGELLSFMNKDKIFSPIP